MGMSWQGLVEGSRDGIVVELKVEKGETVVLDLFRLSVMLYV